MSCCLPQALPSADEVRHKFHVWNSRHKPDNVSAAQYYETELHTATQMCCLSPTNKIFKLMRIGTLIEERPMKRRSHVDYARPKECVGIHNHMASFIFVSQCLTRVLHTASPLFVSHFHVEFLGVFTKLGNATISSLCLIIRMENLGSPSTDIREIHTWGLN